MRPFVRFAVLSPRHFLFGPLRAVLIVAMAVSALLARASIAPAASTTSPATQVTWTSETTGGPITGQVLMPNSAPTTRPLATIFYLKNLNVPRLGQEDDQSILDDFLKDGDLVLVLDYAHHANAVSPAINADLLKLRHDLTDAKSKSLLTSYPVDANHLFIVPEGFRLKRDVEFYRDGKRVLGMDIWYPSKPIRPVPTLMEITCDNANRMGSSSLLFCHDTLVEGAAVAGFGAAMIDHPVPAPYKGIDDPMPACIYRLKTAVRTLRLECGALGLSDQIGAMGFSRGAPMAAFLAVTGDRKDLEGDGPHPEVSSRVQAALVHGNRYDFSTLPADDPMYKRFEKAWGPRDANGDKWNQHGPIFYLTKDAAPMFLNTSNAESKEYRAGLEQLDKRLTELGVEHVYQVDPDGRGHRVSTDPRTLAAIYAFFAKHLTK